MRGVLSVPVLLTLAWAVGLILLWESRQRALNAAQLPWLIAAMLLIAVAMVVALVGVPGERHEQLVRAGLAIEGGGGAWMLARRLREEANRGR
jgi:hypothetical protein